jgi:hypothetical protein
VINPYFFHARRGLLVVNVAKVGFVSWFYHHPLTCRWDSSMELKIKGKARRLLVKLLVKNRGYTLG